MQQASKTLKIVTELYKRGYVIVERKFVSIKDPSNHYPVNYISPIAKVSPTPRYQ